VSVTTLCVLLVEDNRINAELARVLLELEGHEVHLADSAAALRTLLAAELQPDVILLDIRLSDADGRQLVRELRGLSRLDAVPIVAVTAHALVGDADRIRAAGFDGVITKPLDTRTFAAEVRSLAAARHHVERGA
jgi:CheY-like chemotaxis protein